jgi:hypothetical protein
LGVNANDAPGSEPKKVSSRWGGGEAVPFPVASKDAYKNRVSRGAFVRAADKAPIVSMSMGKLKATQPTIDPDELQRFESHPPMVTHGKRNDFGLLIDIPLVVKSGNEFYIHDGHHRLSSAKYRGDSDAKVRLVDLDSISDGLSAFARSADDPTDVSDAAE